MAASSKRGIKEEYWVKDNLKKSRVEERKEGGEEEEGVPEGSELQAAESEAEKTEKEEEVDDGQPKEYIIGKVHHFSEWETGKCLKTKLIWTFVVILATFLK